MLLNDFYHITCKNFDTEMPNALVRLNPDHEIYKAHFPGRPITPGVCQIQMATEILSLYTGAEVCLTDVKNIKYMEIISPEETTELTIKFTKVSTLGESCKVTVVFEKGNTIYSKMSMTYHVVCSDSNI